MKTEKLIVLVAALAATTLNVPSYANPEASTVEPGTKSDASLKDDSKSCDLMPPAEHDEIPDAEKKKVINDLLHLTDLDSRIELIKRACWRSALHAFATAASQSIKADPKNAKASKDELVDLIAERSRVMSKRYTELFDKEISLGSIINDIATRVYSKHFSTKELQDIVTFYKTPTGEKARKMMPLVARESLENTQELMEPKLQKIVTQVLEEEEAEQKKVQKTSTGSPTASANPG